MDTCVCCGAPVPEGRMVCWICEHGGTRKIGSEKEKIPGEKRMSNSISCKTERECGVTA